ncbi:hypothetical protein BC833DRAFT_623433 [Globomyces pollinis-pini]|nr:hypothetical protein BC833DRAFT_623433 [Globomyces pollinis-pini]
MTTELLVAKPTYTTFMEYLAVSTVLLNLVVTIISLILMGCNVLKVSNFQTTIYLFTLLFISLIWQVLDYVAYFIAGPPIVRYLVSTVAMVLTFITALGQMQILQIICMANKTKVRINYFRAITCVLFLLAAVGQMVRIPTLATGHPAWVDMVYKYTYIGFTGSVVLYENFHCVYVSWSLYQLAKSYSEINHLKHDIWKSQRKAYKRLFAMVTITLISDWIALISWMISFSSPIFVVFPATMVFGMNLGIFHVNYVVFIFIQLSMVPLKKHIGNRHDIQESYTSKTGQ